VHSIYNRTPHELLKEIILVNDNSSKPELNGELDDYVKKNFDDRVKIAHLPERRGLIVARMEGAKRATGEVLVFLDSHMEVFANWLPPLLGEV
jgi:polypeptide N-acetylgalactosaminyltransferase